MNKMEAKNKAVFVKDSFWLQVLTYNQLHCFSKGHRYHLLPFNTVKSRCTRLIHQTYVTICLLYGLKFIRTHLLIWLTFAPCVARKSAAASLPARAALCMRQFSSSDKTKREMS